MDEIATGLPQSVLAVSVVLHQLSQSGKLLSTIEIIVLLSALDLDVRALTSTPSQKAEERINPTSPSLAATAS